MILNMDSGSGGASGNVLLVYTNSGATVTVSKGNKTLEKLADSKGGAAFCVSKGAWTVTCSDNDLVETDTIVISEDNTLDMSLNMIPTFTYTGTYELVDDGDNIITSSRNNWKIRFLTSGTLVFNQLNGAGGGIDVFCVGGGAGGNCYGYPAGGGGSGYTTTKLNQTVAVNTEYVITVGNGGYSANGSSIIYGGCGESTSAFGVIAEGGLSGSAPTIGQLRGGDGGSGGGSGYGDGSEAAGGCYATAGLGGVDGSNGQGTDIGYGQGTTTREFGESTGKLYATGGSGIECYQLASGVAPSDAAANTGDGGSGGWGNNLQHAGAGGSGIVVIRNTRNYVDTATYLYNAGDTCDELTGGWVNESGEVSATAIKLYSFSDASTNNGHFPSAYTNNSIDLTNYNSIVFRVAERGSETATFKLCASTSQSVDDAAISIAPPASGVHTMDISSLTGSYYIVAYFGVAYDSGTSYATITEIKLN